MNIQEVLASPEKTQVNFAGPCTAVYEYKNGVGSNQKPYSKQDIKVSDHTGAEVWVTVWNGQDVAHLKDRVVNVTGWRKDNTYQGQTTHRVTVQGDGVTGASGLEPAQVPNQAPQPQAPAPTPVSTTLSNVRNTQDSIELQVCLKAIAEVNAGTNMPPETLASQTMTLYRQVFKGQEPKVTHQQVGPESWDDMDNTPPF